MKKLILVTIMIGLAACTNQTAERYAQEVEQQDQIKDDSYEKFEYDKVDVYHIQEIDGCEYILVNGYGNHEPALTHKGNCKYCLQRNQQQTLETYINENTEVTNEP